MDRQRTPVSREIPRPPRRRRWIWYVGGAVALAVAVPLAGAAWFLARFNPNDYAPQIVAAAQQATGRQLSIGGPIKLQLSLTPTLTASTLSLSNPQGFADPSLLTLDQVQAQIALLPLLHHQVNILRLVLVGPKLYLERDEKGQADWNFAPAVRASAGPAETSPAPHAKRPRYKVALQAVELQNGQIILRGPGGSPPNVIQLTRLTGQASSLQAPLHLTGAAAIGATKLTMQGMVGPVARLTGSGNSPWPVDLNFGFAGASATLQGKVTRPQNASGYDLALNASIPSLASLTAALPPSWLGGLNLPPLQNLTLAARIADQGAKLPAISDISLKAGAADLSSLRPGLTLAALDLELPGLDRSGTLSAKGTLGAMPFTLQGNFTAPSAFIPANWLPASTPPAGNFAESLNASLGNASLSLTGGIATPHTLAGAALALSLSIPDLAALSPAAGTALPGWKNIAVKTTLIDPGGQGLDHAIGFDSLAASMDHASFGGDASLSFGATPKLELDLNIASADIDQLAAAWPSPSASTVPAASQATSPAAPAPAQLVPDIALPVSLLRRASADVMLHADSLTYGKATYSAVQAHAVLNNAVLTINPLTAQLPGGAITASASLDASTDPASASVKLNAPALALGPFLHGFGVQNMAEGTMQVRLDASGRGNTLPALLGSVTGQLGLASVNGVVDGRVIGQIFGDALQSVGLPGNLAGAQGPVSVRCAALRLDAQNGTGTVKALTLDSSRLLLQGGGTVNFADETLGLVLKPRLAVGGTNVTVPVQVGGTFLAPHYSVAPQSAVSAAAAAASGLAANPVQKALGANTLLGQVAGLLGNDSQTDVCPAALSLARMGAPGPAPAAPASAPAAGTPAPASGPRNLLQGILGQ